MTETLLTWSALLWFLWGAAMLNAMLCLYMSKEAGLPARFGLALFATSIYVGTIVIMDRLVLPPNFANGVAYVESFTKNDTLYGGKVVLVGVGGRTMKVTINGNQERETEIVVVERDAFMRPGVTQSDFMMWHWDPEAGIRSGHLVRYIEA